MRTKTLKTLLATTLLALLGQSAFANVIYLTPRTQVVGVGDEVRFDLYIDFLQETVGGSLDIFYDSETLGFMSFAFDNSFLAKVTDPAFSVLPDNCMVDGASISGCSVGDAELNSLGFGSFDGFSGVHRVGEINFITLGTGLGTVTTGETDGPFGPFISAADASTMTVVYNGSAILVVPLPAAVWLMLGAIGALGGLRRR